MVAGLARAFSALASSALDRGARDDDVVDRLNHVVMHALLLFLAIFTATKQYVGTPIYCWLPANYIEKYQRKFANNYCWVNTMYNIPFDEAVPVLEKDRYVNDLAYYRWGTMIFLLLACMFRAPQLVWREFKHFSGVDIGKLVGMTAKTIMMDQPKREEQLGHVAEFIHRWVTTRNLPVRKSRFPFLRRSVTNAILCYGKRSGHNLIFTYLIIKLLYLVNAIAQFVIISSFLKINYWKFGINAVTSYVQHGQWEEEAVFPRVALCDMKLHNLANVYVYTLQCVLGMNLFLEKFFFILWFCFIFMVIVNAASLIRWTFLLLQGDKTVAFLSKFSGSLLLKQSSRQDDEKMLQAMTRNYLHADGVFVLRMIAENCTDLLTADLVKQVWFRYRVHHAAKRQAIHDDYKKTLEENTMNGGTAITIDNVDK